jgi:hypothetical protein
VNGNYRKYAAFFGREPDFVREPADGSPRPISVLRFPPKPVGLFRRLFTPAHDRCVYITCGMSNFPMNVDPEAAEVYPSRIELIAYCRGAYVGALDDQDMVSGCLQFLANIPFETSVFFGPLQTASLGEPLCKDSEMSAFLFALPDGVDMRRLCSCTPQAELVVSVMPISTSERDYAASEGTEKLIELFEKKDVPNLFDPYRRPVL